MDGVTRFGWLSGAGHQACAARLKPCPTGAYAGVLRSRPVVAAVVLASLAAMASPAVAQDQRLVEAVARQDLDAGRILLGESVDVNASQPDGATALHWASHWNDLEMADQLIRAGANVNAVNELGVTPLFLAALNASAGMANALVRAGADPNAARPSGETVLMTGARTGNAELVQALLAAGADVQGRAHFQGQTPLMWAASEGHAHVVQVLLEAGADVHARSKHGTTALLLAARHGAVDTARVLLGAGADVNAAEPLLAVDARIDVEESQTSGRSPLLVASASMVATSGWEYGLVVKPSAHETLAIFLLDQGADPNTPDSIGRTPLHAAVEAGKAALVQALLARGADPNARLIEAPFVFKGDFVAYGRYVGATPLWLAAAARVPNVDILRRLAAAGGDAGAAADDGTTPLMAAVGMVQNEARLAAESEALELVTLLVDLDIDVNAVDRRGQTAMHGAARLARNTLIPVLVDNGARVDIADARGQTPLDVGTVSRPLHPDTASLLRSLGATTGAGSSPR